MAYVYIIRCEDDSLYTGIAKNLQKRMQDHYYKTKACAKYTRAHGIKEIEAVWETDSWSLAAKLESAIKKLDRAGKQELIKSPEQFVDFFGPESSQKYQPVPGITLELCLKKKFGN